MSQRRFQNKQAKELADRIRSACPSAVIEFNGLGHLKVTGPAGTAVLPGKPKLHAKSRVRLARYAGIYLAA
jgi:hypothetical protein